MKKLIATIGLSLCLGSCAGTPTKPDNCLFQHDRPAKVHVEFAGQQVGFCCNKCAAKFQEMNDAEKQKALMPK